MSLLRRPDIDKARPKTLAAACLTKQFFQDWSQARLPRATSALWRLSPPHGGCGRIASW